MPFKTLALSQSLIDELDKCGYEKSTPIQKLAIPVALAGQDVIAKAPTGTGKTAAFILPILERLITKKGRTKPVALVLTPTRELATQILDVIYSYGKQIRVKAINIQGGMPYREQLRELSRPHDIIVATPGRLIDYMQRGDLDFSEMEILVLDEADRMLDMGFIDDVKYIADATPEGRQTLLFTATMGPKLIKLAQQITHNAKHIEIESKNITLDNIEQRVHIADDIDHKSRLLQRLVEDIYKGIIFSATKRKADELTNMLLNAGLKASALHGDMNQRKRNKTITQFRSGKVQLLIATDVAARGIDVNDVTHVINFDLPKFAEDYVHRIGRTGRAGKEGIAISLVLANDGINLKRIERFTGQNIPRHTLEGLEPRKSLSDSAGNSRKKGSSSRKPSQRGFAPSRGRGDRTESHFDRSSSSRSDKPSRGRSERTGESRFDKARPARSDRPSESRFDNPRPSRSSDRPSESRSDRPSRTSESRSDRPSRTSESRSDRPSRSSESRSDRPSRFSESRSDRPSRSRTSESRSDSSRPSRPSESRSDRPSRTSESRSDRPSRSSESRSDRTSRPSRPSESRSDNPRQSRSERTTERHSENPRKIRTFRAGESSSERPSRSRTDKPSESRSDRPTRVRSDRATSPASKRVDRPVRKIVKKRTSY